MVDFFRETVLANGLEVYTAVVATLGVGFWFMDRRSMKAALSVAKESEKTTLLLKRREAEAAVERSFVTLQSKSQNLSELWRNHHLRYGPILRFGFEKSKEEEEISRVVRSARSLSDQFKASAPDAECFDPKELASYFAVADRISVQIDNLATHLSQPNNNSF